MEFIKWTEMVKHIKSETGCVPFSGSGICIRKKNNTAILRSVDNTTFYKDDLDNIDRVKYTLYGQEKDQDINEKRFNAPLMTAKNIYLYRVTKKIIETVTKKGKKSKKTKQVYQWYGKYEIFGQDTIDNHPDKNGNLRKIIVLSLNRIKTKPNVVVLFGRTASLRTEADVKSMKKATKK